MTERTFGLTIIATSDLHGRVRSYDYAGDREDGSMGLEAAADCVARLRAGTPASILVDNGDFLGGHGDEGPGGPDAGAVLDAMNEMGFDAIGLGNHEFDFGLCELERLTARARFTILTSNIDMPGRDGDPEGATGLRSSLLLRRTLTNDHGRRRGVLVGIVSVLPPHTLQQARAAHRDVAGLRIEDPVVAVRRQAEDLRGRGAEIVVALCHAGLNAPGHDSLPLQLARSGAIDAMVMGHTHRVFPERGACEGDMSPGRIGGVPAVMPGCLGQYVGQIDLRLREDADGILRAVGSRSRVHDTVRERARPRSALRRGVRRVTAAIHEAERAAANRIIAHLDRPMTSAFARLGRCPCTLMVSKAMAREVEAQFACGADTPVIGLAAPFMAGGMSGAENYAHLPAGALPRGRIDQLFPFPDRICAIRVTGEDLADWVARTARGFAKVEPGAGAVPLINADVPGSDLHLGADLKATLDLSRPPDRDRVRALFHRDKPVRPEDEIILAVSDYRAMGGGSYPGTGVERIAWRSDISVRGAVLSRISEVLDDTLWTPAFDLRLPEGARAVFRTGAAARDHLHAIDDLEPSIVGEDEDGWIDIALDNLGIVIGQYGLEKMSPGAYVPSREVGAGRHLANPVRSGRKQP